MDCTNNKKAKLNGHMQNNDEMDDKMNENNHYRKMTVKNKKARRWKKSIMSTEDSGSTTVKPQSDKY